MVRTITSIFFLLACFGVTVQYSFAEEEAFDLEPIIVTAPDGGGGIVPVACQNPQTCGTCEFVELINNVIQFIITFSTIAATLLIVYAGFKLVTSGGNVSAKGEARSIITNVVIGYVILLTAFLTINTFLGILLPGDSPVLGWQRIECLYPTQPTMTTYRDYTPELIDAYGEDGFIGFSDTVDGFGDASAVACQAPSFGACTEEKLREAGFGSLAADAARIVGGESGCNPNSESRTDTTTDGRTYSVGTWQINLASNRIRCTVDGQTIDLNCPAAFRPAGTRNKYNVREQVVINETLYRDCVKAAKSPSCNNKIAAGLARDSGDMGDWACTARKCGIQTSRNHLCPL